MVGRSDAGPQKKRRGRSAISRDWNSALLDALYKLTDRRRAELESRRKATTNPSTLLELNALIKGMTVKDVLSETPRQRDMTLLLSKRGRKPSRREILEIADALNCDEYEANELLRTVEYEPTRRPMKGAALEEVAGLLRELMFALETPAFIVARDFSIIDANEKCLGVWGLSQAKFLELRGHKMSHMLWQIFDPDGPVFPRLNPSKDINNPVYQTFLAGIVRSFKMANALAEQEPWYENVYNAHNHLTTFAAIWNSVDAGSPLDSLQRGGRTFTFYIDQQEYPVRVYHITLADIDFPQIVVYVPVAVPNRIIEQGLLAASENHRQPVIEVE